MESVKSSAPALVRAAMLAAVLILTLGASALAQDAPSQYLSFDAPHPKNKSYEGTGVAAINRHGWIAGTLIYAGGMHGYLRRRNGTFIAVNVPGASQTSVWAINAYNEAVGDFLAPACSSCGFLRDAAGDYTQIAVPGANSTQALGINGTEVVVGTEHDTTGYHGFLWDAHNGFTLFEVPGTKPGSTLAGAINGTGTVIGYYFDKKSIAHGFVRSRAGRFTKFDAVAGQNTAPTVISSSGQITGYATDSTGNIVGFLRDTDGAITTFSVSGVAATEATAINDSGVIVGFDFTDGNHPASFERDQAGNLNTLTIPFTNTYTRANGINVLGNVTGFYVDPAGISHGWVKVP